MVTAGAATTIPKKSPRTMSSRLHTGIVRPLRLEIITGFCNPDANNLEVYLINNYKDF
jgi:hypothetical protein